VLNLKVQPKYHWCATNFNAAAPSDVGRKIARLRSPSHYIEVTSADDAGNWMTTALNKKMVRVINDCAIQVASGGPVGSDGAGGYQGEWKCGSIDGTF
jgi:hypothetical protein